MLTVAMPAFNEVAQIATSIRSVVGALDATGERWELVVIDDGSSDGTHAVVDALAVREPRVRLVRHARNMGVGQAIASGVSAAQGAWFMVIPADLAMDLRDLDRYLAARDAIDAHSGNDRNGVAVVAGYTATRPDYSMWRDVVSWANRNAVALLVGVQVRNPNYIHLFRVSALDGPPFRFTGSAALFAEMLRRAQPRGKIVEVPIRYLPRVAGKQTGAKWSLIAKTARDLVRLRLGI